MRYVLSAQPIDEMGVIGFQDRDVIECVADSTATVFALMVDELAAYPEYSAWDMTLTMRFG